MMEELFNHERATELYARDLAKEAAKEANERADKAEAEVKKLKEMLAKLTGNVAVL